MFLEGLRSLWPSKPSLETPAINTRPPRRDFHRIHSRSLPLATHPLPAFIPHNPLSILRLGWAILSELITRPKSHEQQYYAYYSLATRSVHVTDPATQRFLWQCGFFGKGSLSRSEPEWLQKQNKLYEEGSRQGRTAIEATNKRREERREGKRQRAMKEREELEQQLIEEGKLSVLDVKAAQVEEAEKTQQGDEKTQQKVEIVERVISHVQSDSPTEAQLLNQEHLQLVPFEAFFLAYGLGAITVLSGPHGSKLSNLEMLDLFRRNSCFPPASPLIRTIPYDDPFMVSYCVYHHFRALGWVVRPGIKFAADFLLYARGPVFAHAEFAVIVIPDYDRAEQKGYSGSRYGDEKSEWWWLHEANRVQTQVRKSLIIAFVEMPSLPLAESRDVDDIGHLLGQYRVRTFMLKRWSANRNR